MILINKTAAQLMRFSLVFFLFSMGFSQSFAQDAEIGELLANADAARGEKVWRKCRACHTVGANEANKVGPNLYGIVNQPVARNGSYTYSKAMAAYGGSWTLQRLNAYLTKPKAEVPKTKMAFVGLKKETDRVNLIAFLNQNSDTPIEFGASAPSASQEEKSASNIDEIELGVLFAAKGAEETYNNCTACHSERIVAQQGLSRKKWDELLEWMVDEQGMSDIGEPDRTMILDYLAAHYNQDRPNFPSAN